MLLVFLHVMLYHVFVVVVFQDIVVRHLKVLLGYNQSEKSFSVPPYKLR